MFVIAAESLVMKHMHVKVEFFFYEIRLGMSSSPQGRG